MVGLAFALPDVRVDISLLAVVVDSVAMLGVVFVAGDGGVVVASVIVVSIVFSMVFLDFVTIVAAIVVATENSIGIFASQCIILHLKEKMLLLISSW